MINTEFLKWLKQQYAFPFFHGWRLDQSLDDNGFGYTGKENVEEIIKYKIDGWQIENYNLILHNLHNWILDE